MSAPRRPAERWRSRWRDWAARDRDVLLLVAWAELTYEQVAQTMNIPVGTVRSRPNRARRKMREMLKNNDVEMTP